MHLEKYQQAPDFQVKDIFGKDVILSGFRGRKILLTFFRSVGCPVCNLRFHDLEQEFAFFKANNLAFIAVYASTPENMLKYITSRYADPAAFYPLMIPNLERTLYKMYDIESSTAKLIQSLLFHGGFSAAGRGKKLFKDKIADDAPLNLINSDFLIDEQGRITAAYYGKVSGDFISVADIKKFASEKTNTNKISAVYQP